MSYIIEREDIRISTGEVTTVIEAFYWINKLYSKYYKGSEHYEGLEDTQIEGYVKTILQTLIDNKLEESKQYM